MAGPYGSAFTGGYKRSPLGEALAGAGQSIGQGLQAGTQNYVAGQQFQEQKKLQRDQMNLENERYNQSRIDQIERQAEEAKANGADPVEVDRLRDEQIQKIRPTPAASATSRPTGIASITNPQPVTPQTEPQAQPAPGGISAVVRPSIGTLTADAKKRADEAKVKAEADKNAREQIEKNNYASFHDFGVDQSTLETDPVYKQYDVNTLAGSNAVLGEASRRFREAQRRAELQKARETGVVKSTDDDRKERLAGVSEPSPALKEFNTKYVGFEANLEKLKREVEKGDFNAARSTAQSMKGLINALNGQGAMGSEEAAGLMGSIDRFVNTDPQTFRVGRDWVSLQTDLAGNLETLRRQRIQRSLADNLSVAGKLKIVFPDGHAEALTPAQAREAVRKNGAYVGSWTEKQAEIY